MLTATYELTYYDAADNCDETYSEIDLGEGRVVAESDSFPTSLVLLGHSVKPVRLGERVRLRCPV